MVSNYLWVAIILAAGWLLVGCSLTPPAASSNDVVLAFQRAGLEVEGARPMTPQDYGTAPQVCDGMHFLLHSLGPSHGARVYFCEDSTERDALASFYRERGERSPAARSWLFVKDKVVVQLNGALSEERAQAYEAAIP